MLLMPKRRPWLEINSKSKLLTNPSSTTNSTKASSTVPNITDSLFPITSARLSKAKSLRIYLRFETRREKECLMGCRILWSWCGRSWIFRSSSGRVAKRWNICLNLTRQMLLSLSSVDLIGFDFLGFIRTSYDFISYPLSYGRTCRQHHRNPTHSLQ